MGSCGRGWFKLPVIGRTTVAVVVLALASSAGASSGQKKGLYIALGDSIAAGLGASTPYRSYVELYYGHLRSNGSGVTDLLNLAVSGATTTSLRDEQLQRAVSAIHSASDTKAVTIDIGDNDIFGDPRCSAVTAPRCPIATNLRAILTELNTALAADPGHETVQVMENYNTFLGTPNESAWRMKLLGSDGKVSCSGTGPALGLNDLIHCTSIELGAKPVDVLPIFDAAGATFLAPDHIHPDDAGHLAIAKAFGGAATPPRSPPTLAAGRPQLSRAGAGRPFTVSVFVANADTAETVRGHVTCRGSLAGKPLRARSHASLSNGRSSCTWLMPAASRNKPFTGTISVRFHGAEIRRSFSTTVK
jgi:lysophospholipase L1-like esterase